MVHVTSQEESCIQDAVTLSQDKTAAVLDLLAHHALSITTLCRHCVLQHYSWNDQFENRLNVSTHSLFTGHIQEVAHEVQMETSHQVTVYLLHLQRNQLEEQKNDRK